MGLIQRILGPSDGINAAANAVTGVAEVFHANETRRMELSADAQAAALAAMGDEFQYGRYGFFDRMVNGINRLPRPMLAFGTLGLFVFAMVDPTAFSERMAGLNHVPEPLWWLLGAIVSFYFGAREMHYFRTPTMPPRPRLARDTVAQEALESGARDMNPALQDWFAEQAEMDRGDDQSGSGLAD